MRTVLPTKSILFKSLIDDVSACMKCPRMADSARMLGYSAGNLDAELMFIGEAPGRLGADQTHVPFHGDTSGQNFEDLIAFAGINRADIYVTNSVLCNPRDESGNNSTPSPLEVTNCGIYLRRQIELVQPKIVVALGGTALKALSAVSNHTFSLKDHVRTAQPWLGRLLVPLYHPGQRAMIHRSHANQRSDYQFVAETLKRLSTSRSRPIRPTRSDVLSAVRYIVERRAEVSYFELHKLAYLAEYVHVKRTGQRLTSAFFIRQKDGPYCVDLHIQRLKKADSDFQTYLRSGKLMITARQTQAGGLFETEPAVSPEVKQTLDEVIKRYRYPTDADMKRAVYLTAPMRMMLRREKNDGTNLYNAPIDFLAF